MGPSALVRNVCQVCGEMGVKSCAKNGIDVCVGGQDRWSMSQSFKFFFAACHAHGALTGVTDAPDEMTDNEVG
jgi:hypothetical protein